MTLTAPTSPAAPDTRHPSPHTRVSPLHLYLHYISLSIRAQLQYRANFLLQALAQFLITFSEFLALAALFQRFGSLQAWTLPEVAFFYGLIAIAFALAEAIPRGFDVFPRYIRNGDFDRFLLRPRTTVLQIIGSEFQLMRVGRLAQGLLVLAWAIAHLPIAWTLGKIALLLFAIFGGACLFSGLFVLSATLCFWSIESLELFATVTYGGVEAGQFPVTIYPPWFRHLFTFIIPLATINYFPAHALLARPDPLGSPLAWQLASPLAGIAFLGLSLLIWRIGVRHYTSTGC